MIPVLTTSGYQRLVTLNQGPAEIAGKILSPVEDFWRTAERRFDPRLGDYWFAFYFKPKAEQIEAWDNRKPDNCLVGKVAH